ncbi:MFS transporter [Rhodococcus sp. IEGM 1304]|uniref:MFS transporter n=1 Tax=Rhodococcus sp. IEGM 1304 TaxID=3082227 RepID=UPI002954ED24|nr:MFS transporter [Rhodococcus sp. IEGM 1304]MDV8128536.1 MFS transporter [Rhodococcus sp. IEGM 1304]
MTAPHPLPASAISLFAHRDYRHLFGAQLVALFGNGLTTVALGLLAYQLAGPRAGAVLGTALTIKMVAYVLIAPVAGAWADRIPRRLALVGLDLVRASIVLVLPFVDQIWQIYLLIAILQSASAAFTPTFQAVLPDILPDERDYTRALSYSQLASSLETLLSPLLAAGLIGVISFHWLFTGTAAGFLLSAALVVSSRIPDAARRTTDIGVLARILSGVRIFAATPRLRGLMGLNLVVAAVGAIVMVNTVNLVQQTLARSESDVALLLAANGLGVIAVALSVPRALERIAERTLMFTGAGVLLFAITAALALSTAEGGDWRWPVLFGIWASIGAGTGLVLTPTGRVLRRSSGAEDRPALFAAQFSLSHACWLLVYPITGWLATTTGFTTTWAVLAVLAVLGAAIALACWPRRDNEPLLHIHEPGTDPAHLTDARALSDGGHVHAHTIVIDTDHRYWPKIHTLADISSRS